MQLRCLKYDAKVALLLATISVSLLLTMVWMKGVSSQAVTVDYDVKGNNYDGFCEGTRCEVSFYGFQKWWKNASNVFDLVDDNLKDCGTTWCQDDIHNLTIKKTSQNSNIVTLKVGNKTINSGFVSYSFGSTFNLNTTSIVIMANNTVTFTNISNSIDLRYTNIPSIGVVKEEIILKKPPGVQPASAPGVLILFWNSSAPIKTDLITACENKGNCTNVVAVFGKNNVTVSMPNGWLKAAQYPIIIDPSTTLAPRSEGYITFNILTNNYSRNVNPSGNLIVGHSLALPSLNVDRRTFFEFNISLIQPSASVLSVALNLNIEATGSNSPVLNVTHMGVIPSNFDDINASNFLVYADISNGTQYSSMPVNATGAMVFNLTEKLADDLEKVGTDRNIVSFGLWNVNEDIQVTTTQVSSSADVTARQRPVLNITYDPCIPDQKSDWIIPDNTICNVLIMTNICPNSSRLGINSTLHFVEKLYTDLLDIRSDTHSYCSFATGGFWVGC